MAQAVPQRRLPLRLRLPGQLVQQQAEGLHQRAQQAAHQALLALRRAVAVDDKDARRLEHEELVVAGEQRGEPVLLGGRGGDAGVSFLVCFVRCTVLWR